jgi:hypothetical protein
MSFVVFNGRFINHAGDFPRETPALSRRWMRMSEDILTEMTMNSGRAGDRTAFYRKARRHPGKSNGKVATTYIKEF